MAASKTKIIIDKHFLIPEHIKLSDKQKEDVLKTYNVTIQALPKIKVTDMAIHKLDAKPGDIIKIVRKSPTAGEAVYYRGVIDA